MKIQKSGADTGCSPHQDFTHTNLAMLKFSLQYLKLKVKTVLVFRLYEWHNINMIMRKCI